MTSRWAWVGVGVVASLSKSTDTIVGTVFNGIERSFNPQHLRTVTAERLSKYAELEKGNQDRLLPMTPDFAEYLATIPDDQRHGPIFSPLGLRGTRCSEFNQASRHVARIGRAAGVKVNTDASGKIKFTSAHDLRRSFGARWSVRLMPAVLQQLMRHESIDTTLKYYVGQNSDAAADAIWEAAEDSGVRTNVRTSHSGEVERKTDASQV